VLGQLFTDWNVRLDATDMGGLKADGTRTLTAYVDGKKQTGDAANIELRPHRKIALVYGPANAKMQVLSTSFPPANKTPSPAMRTNAHSSPTAAFFAGAAGPLRSSCKGEGLNVRATTLKCRPCQLRDVAGSALDQRVTGQGRVVRRLW
jgi:hypothetical protein